MHLLDQPGVLDDDRHRQRVDLDRFQRRVVVAIRAVRPEIQRSPDPAASADERDDQARVSDVAPLTGPRLIVQRQGATAREDPPDDAVIVERGTHVDRYRVDATARQTVRNPLPQRVDDVNTCGIVIDQRHQAVEHAVQKAGGIGGLVRQPERLGHHAGGVDCFTVDPGGRPGVAPGRGLGSHEPHCSGRDCYNAGLPGSRTKLPW